MSIYGDPVHPTITARRAGPEDAAALATLRGVMLDAMAELPPVGSDATWYDATTEWFADRPAERARFAAFVVDDEHGPVASAVAELTVGAPVPGAAGRPAGHLFSVATAPRARRRGHARACVTAALVWLDRCGVHATDLHATPSGHDLYGALGFVDRPWVPMRRPGSVQ